MSFAWVALAATAIIGGAALACSAAAQTVPEGQSCGGLLCDMGVFGHKTAPKPALPPTAAVVETRAETPAARDEPAEPRPKKRSAQRKKRIAKAKPAAAAVDTPEAPNAPAPATAAVRSPQPSLASAPASATAAAAAGATPTFAAAPGASSASVAAPASTRPAAKAPAPSTAAQPTAILDPFGQTPVNAPFRSLY